MMVLDSYERALLAVLISVGDTQRCSNAMANSRLDFCPMA